MKRVEYSVTVCKHYNTLFLELTRDKVRASTAPPKKRGAACGSNNKNRFPFSVYMRAQTLNMFCSLLSTTGVTQGSSHQWQLSKKDRAATEEMNGWISNITYTNVHVKSLSVSGLILTVAYIVHPRQKEQHELCGFTQHVTWPHGVST